MDYEDFKKDWIEKDDKEILIAILWKLSTWDEDRTEEIIEAMKPILASEHFKNRGQKPNPKPTNDDDLPGGFSKGGYAGS